MKDIRNAEIGDRVCFRPLKHDAGDYAEGTIHVFSASKNRCTVVWDDGQSGIVTDADYDRIHLMVERNVQDAREHARLLNNNPDA